jgi:hypothetical protein
MSEPPFDDDQHRISRRMVIAAAAALAVSSAFQDKQEEAYGYVSRAAALRRDTLIRAPKSLCCTNRGKRNLLLHNSVCRRDGS